MKQVVIRGETRLQWEVWRWRCQEALRSRSGMNTRPLAQRDEHPSCVIANQERQLDADAVTFIAGSPVLIGIRIVSPRVGFQQ